MRPRKAGFRGFWLDCIRRLPRLTGPRANIRCVSQKTVTAAPVSGLEILEQRAAHARTALDGLLDHSSVHYDDVNARLTSIVFIGWNNWQWTQLPDAGQPAVKHAREATGRLRDFARAAVRVGAPDRVDQLDDAEKLLANVIEQPNGSYPQGTPAESIDAIRDKVTATLDQYLRVLRSLPTAQGDGERLLVADTSALLDRPLLQAWRADDECWTIIVLPQVLSELDERKRDSRTREAALKVSRQLEDFDRRGDTFEGVPLAGKLRYRDVAVTADMTKTLPWLRPDVPDDVIIAGALELTWQDLTARVSVVASDRNVRLKARRAGLSTLRPEDV